MGPENSKFWFEGKDSTNIKNINEWEKTKFEYNWVKVDLLWKIELNQDQKQQYKEVIDSNTKEKNSIIKFIRNQLNILSQEIILKINNQKDKNKKSTSKMDWEDIMKKIQEEIKAKEVGEVATRWVNTNTEQNINWEKTPLPPEPELKITALENDQSKDYPTWDKSSNSEEKTKSLWNESDVTLKAGMEWALIGSKIPNTEKSEWDNTEQVIKSIESPNGFVVKIWTEKFGILKNWWVWQQEINFLNKIISSKDSKLWNNKDLLKALESIESDLNTRIKETKKWKADKNDKWVENLIKKAKAKLNESNNQEKTKDPKKIAKLAWDTINSKSNNLESPTDNSNKETWEEKQESDFIWEIWERLNEEKQNFNDIINKNNTPNPETEKKKIVKKIDFTQPGWPVITEIKTEKTLQN